MYTSYADVHRRLSQIRDVFVPLPVTTRRQRSLETLGSELCQLPKPAQALCYLLLGLRPAEGADRLGMAEETFKMQAAEASVVANRYEGLVAAVASWPEIATVLSLTDFNVRLAGMHFVMQRLQEDVSKHPDVWEPEG